MAEEDVLFDEFGNPLNESEDEYSSSGSDNDELNPGKNNKIENDSAENSSDDDEEHKEVVQQLNEQTLESTFGSKVRINIATDDLKNKDEALVSQREKHHFKIEESALPKTTYSKEYMHELTQLPSKVFNVAFCGNIHSGKTTMLDMIIEQTHLDVKPDRFTDNYEMERGRGISLKSNIMTTLLPNLDGVSHVVNFIDTPGHINFLDELLISIRMADCVILFVDSIEGITKNTEIIIEQVTKSKKKFILMLSKVDRLVLELKLSPIESYYKLRNIIDEVNSIGVKLSNEYNVDFDLVSPELNNVIFSSQVFNFVFSLNSFSVLYFERFKVKNQDHTEFAKRLWGDIYYIDGKFKRKLPSGSSKTEFATLRTFVTFILDPIYKIAIRSITLDAAELKDFLSTNLQIKIPITHLKANQRPLLKLIFGHFFGKQPALAMMDSLETIDANSQQNNSKQFSLNFACEDQSQLKNFHSEGSLIAYITRLVDTADCEHFYAQIRVLSGKLMAGSKVKLINDDNKVNSSQKISKCFLQCGRYKYEVPYLSAGSIGLISGPDVEDFITRNGALLSNDIKENIQIKKHSQIIEPVFKVGIQAQNPKEMSKFQNGLSKLIRAYQGIRLEIDDMGKYFINGFGELYLDCALYDLRRIYGKLEINVSDPIVQFNETVNASTKVKIDTKSANGLNHMTVIAEPLNFRLCNDILTGKLLPNSESPESLAKKLKEVYQWDSLAARNVWYIDQSILINDTLPWTVDQTKLEKCKDAIIEGFKWAVNEGPLVGECVRNVRFRIIDFKFANDEIDYNPNQVVSMVKKSIHATMLASSPKIMEPSLISEITCFEDSIEKLESAIKRRRGKLNEKLPIAGTPLFKVKVRMPVIESFGFETDLRLVTRGHAYPQHIHDNWNKVQGDPLNDTVFIPRLKPAPYESLARDFMIKIRRRKGMNENVSLENFVDQNTWNRIQNYFQ